jgi:uncharacterized membrane protein
MRDSVQSNRTRIAAVDAARGAALVGMAVYHLSWDLAYFGLAAPTLPVTPLMRLFSHVVAGAFLALVGVSLVLAHRDAFDRRTYQRRLTIVCGAAALVTIASRILAPGETIYFGILHCIALASLLAAPLLQAPIAVAFAAAAFAFIAPFVFANPGFNTPAIVWLGLDTVPPNTLDWRPLAPWSGFVFLGLAIARLSWLPLTQSSFARWRPSSFFPRALAWSGRHSLAIYLIHQPVLFALFFAATGFGAPNVARDRTNFQSVCLTQCGAGGGTAEHCQRGCQCVVDELSKAGLEVAFSRADLDETQHVAFSRIVQGCARLP